MLFGDESEYALFDIVFVEYSVSSNWMNGITQSFTLYNIESVLTQGIWFGRIRETPLEIGPFALSFRTHGIIGVRLIVRLIENWVPYPSAMFV